MYNDMAMDGLPDTKLVLGSLNKKFKRPNESIKLMLPQWNEKLTEFVLNEFLIPLYSMIPMVHKDMQPDWLRPSINLVRDLIYPTVV